MSATSPHPLVQLQQCSISRGKQLLLQQLNLALMPGEHLAIIGASGSGKTSLLQALLQRLPVSGSIHLAPQAQPIAYVAQIQQFKNRRNTDELYYQQRYHTNDAEDAMTAAEWIGYHRQQVIAAMPAIAPLLDTPLVQLSHGEHKKVQLARALAASPRLLLLDQPFIGLDIDSRQWLHRQLNALAESGVCIILATTAAEIPACITHVLQLQAGQQYQYLPRQQWQATAAPPALHQADQPAFQPQLTPLIKPGTIPQGQEMVRLEDVSIRYGDKVVLQHLYWTVRHGEKWLLHGPNGAGKSTLLSLITADHPQAYANRVYLFGKRRGTGESIWDIKKQIGFVSPELQMYFQPTATCYHTVASGIFDTIGLFSTLHPPQEALVQQWLQLFGFSSRQHRPFRQFSVGEQRLILLARALIKNPPLLVLDEPCQGLDEAQQAAMLRWIDAICEAGNKTLIFVTHDQQSIPACITQTLWLNKK